MEISPKTTKIAVCGLGYVGLPVALLLAKAGFKITGIDRDKVKVQKINRGRVTIEGKEPGLRELMKVIHHRGNFQATTDPSVYKSTDIILVAVETPVEDNHEPAYEALKSALADIGKYLKKGALVIIESTIAPKTMADIVQPILEKESGLLVNKEYFLANCPERVMPGHLLENITYYNRVVGGMDPQAGKLAKSLYKYIVKGDIEITDCVTTEITKAGENAYRDVQIAFANELALLCEAMGADVWQVRRLINNCKRVGDTRIEALRNVHLPGAGVGGHCIPKDSWLLVYGAKGLIDPKLIPLAREINNFMPKHTYHLLKDAFKETGKEIAKKKIVILGYAYDADSDDSRNTPTKPLIKLLEKTDAHIVVHDSYIKEYKTDLKKALKSAQALILMAAHDEYRNINLSKLRKLMRPAKPIIIDGRNCFSKEKAEKLGFVYRGIGNI